MAFTINSKLNKPQSDLFYNPDFRLVLEVHLPILRVHPETQREIIQPDEVYQYEGDLFGLLMERGIPMHEHWLIMRVNRMENSSQFGRHIHHPYNKGTHVELLRPSSGFVDQLRKRFLTKNS